jgi:hypothetical protein
MAAAFTFISIGRHKNFLFIQNIQRLSQNVKSPAVIPGFTHSRDEAIQRLSVVRPAMAPVRACLCCPARKGGTGSKISGIKQGVFRPPNGSVI